jgi:hypothetical protein
MHVDIRLIRIRDFLRTDVHGVVDVESAKRDLKEMAKACLEHGNHHVLMDVRDTDGRTLSAVDVWELAASLEEIGFGRINRVALVNAPKDEFDRAEFFETCAANRGYNFRVFKDFEKALCWLAGDVNVAA